MIDASVFHNCNFDTASGVRRIFSRELFYNLFQAMIAHQPWTPLTLPAYASSWTLHYNFFYKYERSLHVSSIFYLCFDVLGMHIS